MDKEREQLTSLITQWNESRLDLFAISLPDKNLECHGVMRFYHKDVANDGKYATKCIRVSSKSSTIDVIHMLTTKFRTDMRMLTQPLYVVNEVHVDGEMRQLDEDENPLLVQLTWVEGDREGRFVLHNKSDKTVNVYQFADGEDSSFKLTRKLTKAEKRHRKKGKEKVSKKDSSSSITDEKGPKDQQQINAVQQLYSQVPESTFTRTVSNPEVVMKKRRERRLKKIGATVLKVYGDRINPDIPYKSLFLLPTDNVVTVIQDALSKYGLSVNLAHQYRIIKVVLPPKSNPEESLTGSWGVETVLKDNECPLEIEKNWLPHEGTLVFQLRKVTNDGPNSRLPQTGNGDSKNITDEPGGKVQNDEREAMRPSNQIHTANPDRSSRGQKLKMSTADDEAEPPKLLELVGSTFREHTLRHGRTEIGCDRQAAAMEDYIELRGHELHPSHCVVTRAEGGCAIVPRSEAELFVDGAGVRENTPLRHGDMIWIGRKKPLAFVTPGRGFTVADFIRRSNETRPTLKTQGQRDAAPSQPSQNRAGRGRMDSANVNFQGPKDKMHHRQVSPMDGSQSSYEQGSVKSDQSQSRTRRSLLPASLHLRTGAEETFSMEVVSVGGSSVHFKLAPAYTIYLSLRDFIDTYPEPSLRPALLEYLCTVTDLLDQTIQLNSKVAGELSFLMANVAELLNFVRHDRDISPYTGNAQDALAKTVQLAFRHLVQCMQRELFQLMPGFLSESEEDLTGRSHSKTDQDGRPSIFKVLHMLSSTMSLLRRCRVNAALTIQLFSQLFHFINMWLFNEVVCKPHLGLCSRHWSMKIRARLARVEAWAEKQGLELAADCHLARITQAMHLLQAPKQSAEDIAAISGTCFKLNSLQLRALLTQYIPCEADYGRQIPNELIDKVVQVAQSTADELTRSDGREVQLKEDPDLQLPFLLPEDGYSCDVVSSVPSGLTDFAHTLVSEGLCDYTVNSVSSGRWTVYFDTEEGDQVRKASSSKRQAQPEETSITLSKIGGGLGLSIVAARGTRQPSLGIYIRSVVPGGAAYKDGRLAVGDQLLSIDGKGLVGLSQESAAEIMARSGDIVTLAVAKGAAIAHGLATLLETSPSAAAPRVVHRRPGRQHQQQQPRPKSEGFFTRMPEREEEQDFQEKDYRAVRSPAESGDVHTHVQHRQYTAMPASKSRPAGNVRTSRKSRFDNEELKAARSMGNLQAPPDRSKADDQKMSWEAKRALNTYQRNRNKSVSSSTLTSPPPVQKEPDAYARRRMVQSMITNQPPPPIASPMDTHKAHTSPPAASPPVASPPTSEPYSDVSRGQAVSNPNYEVHLSLQPNSKPQGKVKKEEPVKVAPKVEQTKRTEKTRKVEKTNHTSAEPTKQAFSKSATLPSHFAHSQQRAVQEELNALRDEEIDELLAKESLSPLEKNRLNSLLKEREFQTHVEEESKKLLPDKNGSDEDYGVPDRPDRDRLLRLQDDNSDSATQYATLDRNRRKEEHGAKKPQKENHIPRKETPEQPRYQPPPPQVHKSPSPERAPVRATAYNRPVPSTQSSENEEEEEERMLLESKLSQGKSSNYPKFNAANMVAGRQFHNDYGRNTLPREPRPVSDGYMLSKSIQEKEMKNMEESSRQSAVPAKTTKPNSYVVGTQERYLDPRERREAAIKREQSLKRKQQETSFMTFRDRQRLFSSGKEAPARKPAASKKLIDIENSLRRSERSYD